MSFNHSLLIVKTLLLLVIVSYAISYAEGLNNCLASIDNNKTAAVKWPYIDSKYKLNEDHWLTPKQLLYRSLKNIVGVDVRATADKKDTQLADVLNLSVAQLENADFLFDKNIVLVGTGFDQLQIDSAISQLRKAGFKQVFALFGGVRAWDSLTPQKLSLADEISAKQFLLGSKAIPWKVIAIGLTDEEIARLPEKPFKQFDLSTQSLEAMTPFIVDEQFSHAHFISLVLVTSDQKTLQQLKQQLSSDLFSKHVVWLQGGLRNYQDFIEQQNKVIASKGQRLSRPCGINF